MTDDASVISSVLTSVKALQDRGLRYTEQEVSLSFRKGFRGHFHSAAVKSVIMTLFTAACHLSARLVLWGSFALPYRHEESL